MKVYFHGIENTSLLDSFRTTFKLGKYVGVMMGRQLAGSNTCPGLHASECTSQLVLFLYRFCIESDKDQIRRAHPREFQAQSVYSANRYPVNFWLLSQPVILRNNQSWHASYKYTSAHWVVSHRHQVL